MSGCPDVLDAAQQLIEIVEGQVWVLQALVVEHESFDDVFAQALGGPNTKLGGNARLDAVAHRDDGVEVVVLEGSADLPGAFLANC